MACSELHISSAWVTSGAVSVRGAAFRKGNGTCLNGTCLAAAFAGASCPDEVAEILGQLNGFFSVIVRLPTVVICAVDHVRSWPLYYAVLEHRTIISDDARFLMRQLPRPEIDEESAAEYLLTGYVTGQATLIKGLRQVQAGELVWIENGQVHSKTYYEFGHESCNEMSQADLIERLDAVAEKAIERLIAVADGRPIVIPLSGGLDSRLIALHLKQAGYKRIHAFSYGQPGNWEANVSHRVAVELGIAWSFVEYSKASWAKWYHSSEWFEYSRGAEGLVSAAHPQDWPAVASLRAERVVPEDAVFVPGHSADFVAGSHIPASLVRRRKAEVQDVIRELLTVHYRLTSMSRAVDTAFRNRPIRREWLRDSILSRLAGFNVATPEDAINAYEYWDWRERQAKFIVNSVRVYDYWGFEWWLPWWDAEFMSFWDHVPLRFRVGKRLYDQYVAGIQGRLGVSVPVHRGIPAFPGGQRLRTWYREAPAADPLRRLRRRLAAIRRRLTLRQEYAAHPLAWYGITDIDRFLQLLRDGGNVYTIIVYDQFERLVKEVHSLATS